MRSGSPYKDSVSSTRIGVIMRVRSAAVVVVGAFALVLGPATAVLASGPIETDLAGPIASDQSLSAGSLVTDTVTAPAATSVNGSGTASLTSEVVPSYYTDSPDQLQVYTSTESGTSAITGVVTGSSGEVSGATVSLAPSAGGSATTVQSDSNGGFAFVNIPIGSSAAEYTLTVSASGYGSYTVTNDTYLPDSTYETTVDLTTSVQSYDASQTVSQSTQNTAAAGSLAPYTSTFRPPPTIKVAVYRPLGPNCTPSGSPTVKSYPFAFYVMHVTVPEIGTSWPETVTRANMLAQSNYAWYFLRHPPNSSWNVDNTTNYQCFEPWVKVPTQFHSWLDNLLGDSSMHLNGDIQLTGYRAGSYKCSDPNFPQNGNLLSQWGSLALNKLCGYSYYKNIDNYYYTGSFASSTIPPVPNTSYSRPTGGVRLNFPSQVSDGNGHTSHVGWKYTVEEYLNRPVPGWYVIYNKGWVWSSRSVPTSFTNWTSLCLTYRVRAMNPVGVSKYASFNGGGLICPG
jgi:hypothetical protein